MKPPFYVSVNSIFFKSCFNSCEWIKKRKNYCSTSKFGGDMFKPILSLLLYAHTYIYTHTHIYRSIIHTLRPYLIDPSSHASYVAEHLLRATLLHIELSYGHVYFYLSFNNKPSRVILRI
ncbi:hypothetical protein HanRHA438_Chr07g0291931 [Helianthus annuus]|nr:hypothetical protein HanRHA438_Chr07g0291931 [Helianthus annuus]